jgi:hypothetical protein
MLCGALTGQSSASSMRPTPPSINILSIDAGIVATSYMR